MDIEALLPPISPAHPCGVDFDLDPELGLEASRLEGMAAGELDSRTGARLRPNWPQVARKALDLCARGKNLHVAAILTESACVLEAFCGLRDGLRLMREWCDRYWDEVYPREDRQIRLSLLNREQFLIKPLLALNYAPRDPMADPEFHQYWEAFLKVGDSAGREAADARLTRLAKDVFARAEPGVLEANVPAMVEALAHVKALKAKFDAAYGAEDSISLGEMEEILEQCVRQGQTLIGAGADAAQSQPGAAGAGATAAATPSSGGMTHASAKALLDQVIRHFEKTEPSSPVPYLLKRAQRCIGKTFVELLDELAPDKSKAMEILQSPQSEQSL